MVPPVTVKKSRPGAPAWYWGGAGKGSLKCHRVCPWSRDDCRMPGLTSTLPGECLWPVALWRDQCDRMSEF
jgi:hypothetical protein